VKELAQTIGRPPYQWTPEKLWQAYEQLDRSKVRGGEKEVSLGGGASVAQQYVAAGLLDEIVVSIVLILRGSGARLFANVGDATLEQVESVEAPGVTHIRYTRA
jgi:dihydrofolate reductase